MATIRDHVRATLGETYQKLTESAGYDDTDKPDAVGLKIDSVISRVFVDGTTEEALSEFSKMFVAIMVVRLLIPLATDYYMVNTSHTGTVSRPPGVTPLGGETFNNYDRVAALNTMEQRLAAQQSELRPDFLAINRSFLRLVTIQPGARVSTSTRDLLTDDPRKAFWGPRQPLIFGGEFGVFWGIVPEQPYLIDPNDNPNLS